MASYKHDHFEAPDHQERRSYLRSSTLMSVRVGLLMPEISPEPQIWRGIVRNLSAQGMMLEILSLDPDTYKQFHSQQRHVVVHLPQADQRDPREFKGRVVWLDYRTKSKPREICYVGLLFENLTDDETRHLQALVDREAKGPETSY